MGKDLKGKELGKGINQRKTGKYCGNFKNRFGKRVYVYGDTARQVKVLLEKAKEEDIRLSNVVDDTIVLDEWFEKWMRVYKVGIKPTSKQIYNQVYLSKIHPTLGRERLSKITKLQLQGLINDLEKEYSWQTVNKVKIMLVDMFDRALEDDFVKKNLAKTIKINIPKPDVDCVAFSKEEQNLFMTCAKGTFYYNAYLVMLNTGMRCGELFGLKESDIDFDKNTIHIQRTLVYQKLEGDKCKTFHVQNPKTQKSDRIIPMTEEVAEALRDQIRIHNLLNVKRIVGDEKKKKLWSQFSDFLFTTKFRTPLNSQIMCDNIKKLVEEINLMRDDMDQIERFGTHRFRHTFATRCFEAGMPPKTVQHLLGHASLQMTMDLYTDVLSDKKKEDMQLFEEYMRSFSM